MDKKITIIDENERELGETTIAQAHQQGLLHRASVIYLTNDAGQILVQQRIDDGRLDHSAAGHVDMGESYLVSAKRELYEELGVSDVSLTEIGDCTTIESHGTIKHKFKVYQCKADPVRLEPSEVKSVFWADALDIWNDMQNDPQHKKYTGCFKTTLHLYLKCQRKKDRLNQRNLKNVRSCRNN